MVGVGMGCHHNFVTFEGTLCKLNCYSMSKCWFYLIAARVRLYEVIVANAASFAVHLTGVFEFLISCGQRTVESCHIFLALGLVVAADVVETFLATAAVLSAYRCYRRHYFTSRSS